ncbi:MAG: UDP-glucose 4-epimerase GalE [Flavobacteriales bacterium]|jgi:UDP-glucose 4-epimerase|nr:UDP-glucose 4-epimerase GalE [Flavobacteriales bacterium]MBK6551455.1 UDP-glucose 4-epimerase GalE [Flavobacteriales bacterium]MBK6882854.1 UDP-glucose 4-epimerase GalE [Flavobacteriales bacterium]MBK7101847.1 UDP-glucose 4-epimerase GalE [Flavobacteriales bacterium]MBK7114195.1 UDP-glucose 4-epimerase GalE [Flavobacteriales bacterium]
MEERNKVLVTGGAGYIGSHTIIELLEHTDAEVVSVDNFSNADRSAFDRVAKITGRQVRNHELDLCDPDAVLRMLEKEPGITGVIHFAAFKSVPESVADPHKYYHNNIASLLALLEGCIAHGIGRFIFSSSCSVYGNIDQLPVGEDSALGKAESPYGYTKQIGERIIEDYARNHPAMRFIALRYFNPVGAHASGLNGEAPLNPPSSLVPVITRTAIGKRSGMVVHGSDYATRDGSCIRDYVHVSDIASAHVRALDHAKQGMTGSHAVFNLGTGEGVSVLEAIAAFESASGVRLNYTVGPRREGDVGAIYSDTKRSRDVLGWKAQRDLHEMMASAWKWEQQLAQEGQ